MQLTSQNSPLTYVHLPESTVWIADHCGHPQPVQVVHPQRIGFTTCIACVALQVCLNLHYWVLTCFSVIATMTDTLRLRYLPEVKAVNCRKSQPVRRDSNRESWSKQMIADVTPIRTRHFNGAKQARSIAPLQYGIEKIWIGLFQC